MSDQPKGLIARFLALPTDSVPKTIFVAVSLCLVASMIVSAAAVSLRPIQEINAQKDKQINILQVAGVYDPEADVVESFAAFEPQVLEIVLLPLDHRAVRHRGVLDGDEIRQRAIGNDESTDVLREVSRKTHDLADQVKESANDRALRVEARLQDTALINGAAIPPLHRLRQPIDLQS